mgnify:CR=1 FL=1
MDYKTIKNTNIGEELFYGELNSGLKIYYLPKKNYMKKYAVFGTKYGSNDNTFIPIGEEKPITVPEGIAHFLEHKLFEDPEHDIFTNFAELGSYVNAYTNFNQTAYLFSCTDNFYENLELLIKFVQNPYFTDENVEKEKGIIAQEIKMYEDSPNWRVFFNCLKGMYYEHPVKIDIAGTVDSIKKIDKETLYRCYRTFYHPSNMILFVTGDLSFEKIMEAVNKVERKDIPKPSGEIKRIFPDEPKKIKQDYLEEYLMTAMPIFAIGFKDYDLNLSGEQYVRKEITTNILLQMLFGESSEFYQEMYDNGLIDSNFGTQYIGYKDYGHSLIVGESDNPQQLLEKVTNHLNSLKSGRLSEEDFLRIKKKNIGYNLMGFNSVEYLANNFISYYFNDFLFINYADILESITFEDINSRFNSHFTKDNYTLSIVKPMK